jgi:hypothetical protein
MIPPLVRATARLKVPARTLIVPTTRYALSPGGHISHILRRASGVAFSAVKYSPSSLRRRVVMRGAETVVAADMDYDDNSIVRNFNHRSLVWLVCAVNRA